MQLFARLGRRSEAAAHFQKLAEEVEKAGRKLSAETHELYEKIMS
jgi:hypothetical protein